MDVKNFILGAGIIFGLGIVGSYIPIIKDQVKGNYDYWFGIQPSVRYMAYVFQILAAVGFLVYGIDLLSRDLPSKGLYKNSFVLPSIITIFLVSALAWSILVQLYKNNKNIGKVGIVLSLIITAICGILLLAGEFENPDHSRWYNVLGLIFLCIVVVLFDAVGWNANFILT